MTDRVINAQGQVLWDEREELNLRDGESFTATCDCPKCGHIAVHWLAEPRLRSYDRATPAGRAMAITNAIVDHMAALHDGRSHFDHPCTTVARVCVRCEYRWGQR